MKSTQEKVKDFVEVHVYRSLQDFISDPAQTLSAYHFTDATSEMMVTWLDSIAGVEQQNGAAKALAGYRGVGKSHFFATFGAIVSHPELRTKITDAHAAASAQNLKRRRYPVAFVRRGTHETLLEEIKEAIAKVLDVEVSTLSDNLTELVQFAVAQDEDLPFVLMVDTASEREERVLRNDGVLLGELAEITKNLNFFVGVALDDDIATADGVNAAITRNYTIDYLDHEHLYRVVETHIFPKHQQTQPRLHDIYENFRKVLPGFRWSEQRFVSLYPVHPIIMESAPFIRLYATDFAFLGFASEAGNKVLGRPANSLVALDEVFDRVENSLRKSPDLTDAFATYDRLNTEVVAHIPVMQRLQAKLTLKALLLLSLHGEGATAREIGAAMLIYDESDPQKAIKSIEDLLETFVSVFPDQIRRKTEIDRETLFSLKVRGKDNLNDALAEAVPTVPNEVFENILRRLAREKFPDWTLQLEDGSPNTASVADCQVNWRGSFRRGRIIWNWQSKKDFLNPERTVDFLDWEVIVSNPQNGSPDLPTDDSVVPVVAWQPAALRADEEDTLRRYHILLTDNSLREMYGEQVGAAGHSHQKAVRKIWNRIFLEEGKFVIDGDAHSFMESAKAAPTLSDFLSQMLIPLFESRYPEHPLFERNLGMNEVATLVNEHFSGAKPTFPEVQELAQSFALPLGLVALHGNYYVLNSQEKLLFDPFVKDVMTPVVESGGETVSLKDIYRELKREPYGLVREAAHLVLAALVAQRQIEFVTSTGDRINRRSLDLQIIWDDIIGVATPSTVFYGSAKFTEWARTLTGAGNFKTMDDAKDREKIKQALENWLAEWRESRVLERFEELPDDILTTKIWRLATRVEKAFGTIASTIELVSDQTISLEEGLQRVADAFSDSEEEFLASTKELVTLKDFINGDGMREKIENYLAVCEPTQDEGIEELRGKLWRIIEEMNLAPDEALNIELDELWEVFHAKFSEYFALKHYGVMKSHELQEKFDEILQSDEWWEFENLSAIPIFQKIYWQQAQQLCRRLNELNCRFDVQELLKEHPFCACSFRLSEMNEWESLPRRLSEIIEQGRAGYRKTLSILNSTLAPLFENFEQTEESGDFVEAARHLSEIMADDGTSGGSNGNNSAQQIPLLKNEELIILGKAVRAMPASPLLEISFPTEKGFLTREELRLQLSEWLDDLPSEPILLKI